jgi:peptidyl-prolyl cis-trans isomerase SurA
MKRASAIVFLLIAMTGSAWAQVKIDQIAARVNGDIILKSEIDREIGLRRGEMLKEGADPARVEQMLAEQADFVLGDLIDRLLLVQVAKEAGLTAELDVLKTMEQLREENKFTTMEDLEKAIIKDYGDLEEFKNDIRTKFLTQQVVQHEVYSRIVITNEEMRKYYDEHTSEFDKPAGVRLSEIVILVDRRLPDQVATQRKKAEEALAALKKGDDFGEIAEKYSEVSTGANGGDIGFLAGDLKEQTNEIVAKALENLGKDQITDIVEMNDAFVIYKVTDKHSGGILPFELAQQFIWPQFMGRIAPGKVREFLVKLREDGFVEVKPGFKDAGAKPIPGKTAAANP